jgi:tetratricopeptide (TPR) repeat protein
LSGQDLSPKPLHQLYLYLYQMLQAPARHQETFFKYVGLFRECSARLSPETARPLLYYAINYCIGRIRDGERSFAPHLLQLYQQGIDEEILIEEKQLSPWTYKNMVKLGLNLKRYDWVEDFVKAYSDYLPKDQQQDALHYNLAELYFFRADYESALDQLRQVEFTDIHYNLGSRTLLVKIYYEQGASDALEACLKAFEVFLRRNRSISTKVKTPYVNFIRLSGALLRQLPESYPSLKAKIEATSPINNRDWLLGKLE